MIDTFLFWFLRPLAQLLGELFTVLVILVLAGLAFLAYLAGIWARESWRRKMFPPRSSPPVERR